MLFREDHPHRSESVATSGGSHKPVPHGSEQSCIRLDLCIGHGLAKAQVRVALSCQRKCWPRARCFASTVPKGRGQPKIGSEFVEYTPFIEICMAVLEPRALALYSQQIGPAGQVTAQFAWSGRSGP
jgi:hypothetical protein